MGRWQAIERIHKLAFPLIPEYTSLQTYITHEHEIVEELRWADATHGTGISCVRQAVTDERTATRKGWVRSVDWNIDWWDDTCCWLRRRHLRRQLSAGGMA